MLAVLETLLALSLAASFLEPIPWWGLIAPVALIIMPLNKLYLYPAVGTAAFAVGCALWAIISKSTEQPQTLVVFALLITAAAPRPGCAIYAAPQLNKQQVLAAKYE
ncbi:MAG: hypothetical protein CL678_07565 [Bdellovibrionaceae bacterium]|nr:hypothetical protein [Pseudobdellovibrionaceae bacterium]|tara:strand:- start:53 stop:373 length:321 start_codon:yes stop_codon:yes gene_type:complete